jgi:hypothetical protein
MFKAEFIRHFSNLKPPKWIKRFWVSISNIDTELPIDGHAQSKPKFWINLPQRWNMKFLLPGNSRNLQCKCSSVGFMTSYGLENQDSIPRRGNKFFPSPLCPDRLWASHSILSNVYLGGALPSEVKWPWLKMRVVPPLPLTPSWCST